jgi:hypothetical protein
VAPMNIENDCVECERLKKHLEQLKAECHNKGRRVAMLETELGRLKTGGFGRRGGGGYYDRDY